MAVKSKMLTVLCTCTDHETTVHAHSYLMFSQSTQSLRPFSELVWRTVYVTWLRHILHAFTRVTTSTFIRITANKATIYLQHWDHSPITVLHKDCMSRSGLFSPSHMWKCCSCVRRHCFKLRFWKGIIWWLIPYWTWHDIQTWHYLYITFATLATLRAFTCHF